MTPARFRLLTAFGHGVNDLYFFALPLVLPLLLREFSLSYRLAGLVLAVFLGVVSLCSFILGRISDRLSPWLLIGGGFLLASAGFLGGGLAPALAAVLPLLALGGIGVAAFHPLIYALIDRLTPRKVGQALGFFEFWGGLSILAMYLGGGALLRSLGWRGVLLLVGSPGLVMGALFLRQGIAGRGEAPRPDEGQGPLAEPPPRRRGAGGGLLLFLLTCLLRLLSATAVINFMPTYLAGERALPPDLAAYATAFIFAGGLAASALGGRAADRFSALPVLLLASGGIAPFIFLFSLPLPFWAALLVLALFGAFHSGCGPAQNLILSRLGAHLGRGTVFGLLLAATSLISALSPALFGLLADHLGLALTMKLFALPALTGWLILAAFSRAARRQIAL